MAQAQLQDQLRVQANRFTNDVIVRCIKARPLAFGGLAFDDDVPRQLQ